MIIGEAMILIRATDAGFEATVVKDVEKAMLTANKAAKIKAEADVTRATGPLDVLKGKLQSFAGKNPMTSAMKDIETSAGGAEGALGGLATGGIAIAAAAITAFAVKGVADFMSLTAQARQVQRTMGGTAEDASRFAAAFRAVGIDVAAGATAIGRFERTIAATPQKVKDLGIEVARTAKGTVDMRETFLNLSDAIAKTDDPTQRANIAITALGRSGLNMLPILASGRQRVQELFGEADKTHTLFNDKDLQTGKDLSLAFKNIKESITGLFAQAGKVVAPFVLDVIHLVQGIGDLGNKFSWLGTLIKAEFAPLQAFAGLLHGVVTGIEAITGKTHEAAAATEKASAATDDYAGSIDNLTGKSKEEVKAIDTMNAKIDKITGALMAVTSAKTAEKTADEGVATARKKVNDATDKLNELTAKGVVNTTALTSAQAALVTAQDSLAAAQQRVADTSEAITVAQEAQKTAQQAVTDAQQAYDDLVSGRTAAKDMVGHQHDMEKAQLAVRQSTLAQKDAADNLTKVQSSGLATTEELEKAQLALDQANLNLKESQESVGSTQAALTAIQDEGVAGSTRLKAAQQVLDGANKTLEGSTRTLEKANRDHVTALDLVADSAQKVIDKQVLLDKALLPDPAMQKAIVQAKKDIETANHDVKAAVDGVSKAHFDMQKNIEGLDRVLETSNLPDLKAALGYLQQIKATDPGSAAFVQPIIDLLNNKIGALTQLVAAIPVVGGGPKMMHTAPEPVGLGSQGGFTFDPGHESFVGGAQSGGYMSGSFWVGEAGKPEVVSLRPGGGAMVYTAEGARAAGRGSGIGDIHVHIDAQFGPGSNQSDIAAGLRGIAENEVAGTLLRIIDRSRAGAR